MNSETNRTKTREKIKTGVNRDEQKRERRELRYKTDRVIERSIRSMDR